MKGSLNTYFSWDPEWGSFLNYLYSKVVFFANYEARVFSKNYDVALNDINASLALFPHLYNFFTIEKANFYKKIVGEVSEVLEENLNFAFIPPKYDFWPYFVLFLALYSTLNRFTFLYYKWTEKLIHNISKDSNNFIPFFSLKDNVGKFDNRIISFSSEYPLGKHVPSFSTLIVTEYSDLDMAIELALNSAFRYGGLPEQAMKRVLINEKVYQDFLNKLYSRLAHYVSSLDTIVKSSRIINLLKQLILDAISEGAELIWGANFQDNQIETGIVLVGVKQWMRIFQKKFYGPVLCVVSYTMEELPNLINLQPSKGIIILAEGKSEMGIQLNHFSNQFLKYGKDISLSTLNINDSDISNILLRNPQLVFLLKMYETL